MKFKEIRMMKYIGILLVGAMLLTSCFDDPGTEIILDESFVELDAARTVSQSVPFAYTRLNDGNNVASGIKVNRVSTNSSNAVNVTIAIDPASTAIEGLHYVVTSSSVTIPAGEFSADLNIEVIPDNIEAGEALNLIVEIVSADLPINETVAKATHVLSVLCPVESTFVVGDYLIEQTTPFADGVSNSLSSGTVVTVSAVDGEETGRTFSTENYPTFCAGDFALFRFDLVCGNVVAATNTSTCPCGAGPFLFGPATTSGTVDLGDDSTFTLVFTDDVTSNCGAPVQTSYTFTKQ